MSNTIDQFNILDEILFEERYFRDIERGLPKFLYISPDNYAELLEQRGVDPLEGMTYFHGMEVIVSEDIEEIEIK